MAKPSEPAPQEDVAAMVDRLLKKLRRGNPTLAPLPTASSSVATGVAARPASSVAQRIAPRPVSSVVRAVAPRTDWPAIAPRSLHHPFTGTRQAAAWAWVVLGVLLGAALPQWPYERTCGWSLLWYLVAVALVIVTGMHGALLSWRSRLGLAHVIALSTILWGLVLVAHEVLPRVGYTRTLATWQCVALDGADRRQDPSAIGRARAGGIV